MPIDYSVYPANWKDEIRPKALAASGYKCVKCQARQRAQGYRDAHKKFIECDEFMLHWCAQHSKKIITIYLSVAHLDHDISNNVPENLAPLCQQCHNRHDAAQRSFKRSLKFNSKNE
jgi:hypothetical protein